MGKNTNNAKNKNRINRQIRVDSVRLVGDNVDSGIYDINDALNLADNLGVDLIEISPNANPPVCKLIDFKKFLYEQKKKQKEQEKKNKKNNVELKEMRFRPNTDEHDLSFKKKHIEKFLKSGDRVKAYVFFKGREIQFKAKGQILLLELADELSDISTVEKMPVMEGNKMVLFLKPKK